MNIKRNNLSKSQIELTVELSVAEIKPYVENAAKKVSQEVNISGFRKGHVPYNILKTHVGEASIYEEAFKNIVSQTLPKVLVQEKIEVIGQPEVQPEKIAPNNPIIYKAKVWLYPKIELCDYKNLGVQKKVAKVSDETVDKTLGDLRRMRASEKVVTRQAKKGDKVVMDFDVLVGNVVVENGSYKKQDIEIGSGHFIPGFEDNIVGMKKNDKKDFKLRFPKEYHDKNLSNKEAMFKVNVLDIYEIELPKLDDEWAKSLGGFKNVDELKKALRTNIEKEEENKKQQEFENQLIEKLVEKSTFGEIPEMLIDAEIDKMTHELEHSITDQGGKFDEYLTSIKKKKEDLKKDFRNQAEKRVKSALALKEIVFKEKIKVVDEEVNAEIDKMKKYYQRAKPEIMAQLESAEYKRYVRNVIANQKIVHFIAEKNSSKK